MGHQKDTQRLVISRSLPIHPVRILGMLNHNLGVSQTDQNYVVLWPLWSSLWPKLLACASFGEICCFIAMNFSLTLPVGGLKKPMFRHIQIINSWWYIPLYPETSFRYGSLMLVISSIIIIIQGVQPSTVTPPKNRTHIYHCFGRCFLPFF